MTKNRLHTGAEKKAPAGSWGASASMPEFSIGGLSLGDRNPALAAATYDRPATDAVSTPPSADDRLPTSP